MATAVQTETCTIRVNDIELVVPKGELIVESVKRLGLEVPVFCYHPRMKPVGMCRMCLVEVGFAQPDGSVRKMPKPQAACTLPASDGMVITTDSEALHRDRKGVLEFLLINHPLDCPICDRGGECPLQNNTMAYGPSTTRFVEMKRHLPKAYPLSKYVTLDLERCIQCGRCVRFTEEISGDHQLAFRFRGAAMQPATFQLTDFESKFSGNVIEICPVGALTNAKYRFRARPWDLETAPAICTLTPCGTNIWFDYRAGKFVRINGRTNEAVNEEWTSDRTKFGHDFYNHPERLTAPNVRVGDKFERTSWSDAYAKIQAAFEGGSGGLLIQPSLSNESLFLGQRLFREGFGSAHIDHRGRNIQARADRLTTKLGVSPVQSGIADLESATSILIVGTSLADEQPMSYLRARKAATRFGVPVIVATSHSTEVEHFAQVAMHYKEGSVDALVAGLTGEIPVADAANKTGVRAEDLEAAKALLSAGTFVLTTHSLLGESAGAAEGLARWAQGAGAKFNCWGLAANSQGALNLGVLPDTLPGGAGAAEAGLDTLGMLKAAADGHIKSLFLVGFDPFEEVADRDLVTRALENVEFLVVMHSQPTEAMGYASLVLPMALAAEQDGTYTSAEGRVQRMKQILPPPGEAKAAWKVFAELMLRVRPGAPFFNPAEVMAALGASVPAYAAAAYEHLEGEGVLVRL